VLSDAFGQSLDLRVVAEGVEDAETLDELRRLECDEVQGYLIGSPMTAAAFASWLQQGGHDQPPAIVGGAQEPLSAA
jgi:EAL domain-containing protein (putative c-di-GMP-specific phosphodiesterase class I)